MKKYFDTGSLIVIIATFTLFVAALFSKGLTHDLLLEAGVFLVSVKLILMSYKTGSYYKDMSQDLKKILETLTGKKR